MRLTSRRALTLVMFSLASPMFSVRAGDTVRTASLRPMDPDSPRARERDGELIVQFRADTAERDVARLTREAGAARVRRSAFGNRYLVAMDAGFTPADAMSRLAGAPEVEFAERNGRVHAFFHPNDRFYAREQWNFFMLNAERTWDIQKG